MKTRNSWISDLGPVVLSSLLLLFVTQGAQSMRRCCDAKWLHYKGVCYYVTPAKLRNLMTHDDAQKKCESMGKGVGLGKLRTKTIEEIIYGYVEEKGYTHARDTANWPISRYWIGMVKTWDRYWLRPFFYWHGEEHMRYAVGSDKLNYESSSGLRTPPEDCTAVLYPSEDGHMWRRHARWEDVPCRSWKALPLCQKISRCPRPI